MKTLLDTAHTWFLESSTQHPDGALHIRLAEGIKGAERLPVPVSDGVTLGPYFPVTVEPGSRTVEIRFPCALAVLTYNESYDKTDPCLIATERTALQRVGDSSFRQFLSARTSAIERGPQPLTEWLLWTEDQVFQVFASGDPQVVAAPAEPDLSIERTSTWSAS